jgi:hypothetical protein
MLSQELSQQAPLTAKPLSVFESARILDAARLAREAWKRRHASRKFREQSNRLDTLRFRCPLLAQSGHVNHARRRPLSGVKRTLPGRDAMSLHLKKTVRGG